MDQKELRRGFIQYLQIHYDYARPEIMASNVFYAWHHRIGMDFWEIFKNDDSMREAQNLLIKKFEEAGRKNPKGNAAVYFGCWEKFREFLLDEQVVPSERVHTETPAPVKNKMDAALDEDVDSEVDLSVAMDVLRLKRKLFHSEADFQFALAWEIQTRYPDADVRLEYCPVTVPNMHIDILITLNGNVYPVELKYKTLGFDGAVDAEAYHLKSHGAQDIGKYDCLLDLQRTEKYRSALQNFACGFIVWLTNDPLYWSAPKRAGTMAGAFDLSNGSVKSGVLRWAPHTGEGTQKNRTEPIRLADAYTIRWHDYSKLSNSRSGRLRYALLKVKKQEAGEGDG